MIKKLLDQTDKNKVIGLFSAVFTFLAIQQAFKLSQQGSLILTLLLGAITILLLVLSISLLMSRRKQIR